MNAIYGFMRPGDIDLFYIKTASQDTFVTIWTVNVISFFGYDTHRLAAVSRPCDPNLFISLCYRYVVLLGYNTITNGDRLTNISPFPLVLLGCWPFLVPLEELETEVTGVWRDLYYWNWKGPWPTVSKTSKDEKMLLASPFEEAALEAVLRLTEESVGHWDSRKCSWRKNVKLMMDLLHLGREPSVGQIRWFMWKLHLSQALAVCCSTQADSDWQKHVETHRADPHSATGHFQWQPHMPGTPCQLVSGRRRHWPASVSS